MESQNPRMERRVEELDRLTPSPEDRAQVVYNTIKTHLPEATNWDVICFCINYLALSSLSYEWLKDATMHLARQVYNAHYFKTEELGLTTQAEQKSKLIITPEEWRTTSRKDP